MGGDISKHLNAFSSLKSTQETQSGLMTKEKVYLLITELSLEPENLKIWTQLKLCVGQE